MKRKQNKNKYKPARNKIYKIDQSGRVEYTSHDTIIAFSNGKKKAIKIKAEDKRLLQRYSRDAGKRRVFTYRIFALLIFLLLKNEEFEELIIDTEYPGRGDLIKNYLLHDFEGIGRKIEPNAIHFRQIGKNCEAHWHGYYVFKNEREAKIIVSEKEVLNEIFH